MTKVISLSDEAYENLRKLKGPKESFSDVVNRLSAKEKRSLTEFAGKWSGPKEELDALAKRIREEREAAKSREVKPL
ncbi:antitoxin VapB family protein [Candidatus Woesearchaeota archaeon]|nr:antitoxin VapB family protein [Candidatus Woesearchaeota archaeon]